MTLGHIFTSLQDAKIRLGIAEYSLTQPSLEQVFLRFANEQACPDELPLAHRESVMELLSTRDDALDMPDVDVWRALRDVGSIRCGDALAAVHVRYSSGKFGIAAVDNVQVPFELVSEANLERWRGLLRARLPEIS